jgi:hypothetical protein
MKPNEKQIKFIDECVNILKHLKNTSDISNQAHTTFIQDSLNQTALECDQEGLIVPDNEVKDIGEAIEALLVEIRKLS